MRGGGSARGLGLAAVERSVCVLAVLIGPVGSVVSKVKRKVKEDELKMLRHIQFRAIKAIAKLCNACDKWRDGLKKLDSSKKLDKPDTRTTRRRASATSAYRPNHPET